MRRMLPQKLIDYIKQVKNNLSFVDEDAIFTASVTASYVKANEIDVGENDDIIIDGNGVVTPAIHLTIPDVTFNDFGDGIEVDSENLLKVKLAQDGGLSFDENGAIQSSGGSSSAIAYDGVSLLPSTIEFDSWNLHRGILLNGVLWVVITGMTASASGLASISDIVEITLPSEIASKLYRMDGTSCNNAPSTNNYICFGIAKNQGTDINLYSSEANKIKVKFDSPITVSAGNRAIFNVRFPLFLDIGSVE